LEKIELWETKVEVSRNVDFPRAEFWFFSDWYSESNSSISSLQNQNKLSSTDHEQFFSTFIKNFR
jgi:hypothetical protein